MAFTKVVGAGIHTLSNITSHNINSSGIITATKFVGPFDGSSGDFSGDVTIDGNLVVNGTTTTLDTNLIDVDKVEVTTAGTNVAVAVTHNGTGDLIRLYDGTSQVVTVDDEGNVGIGSTQPLSSIKLDVVGKGRFSDDLIILNGNELTLLNDANTANIKIDCDGGARLNVKSYDKSVIQAQENWGIRFFQGNETERLAIEPTGGIVVGAGGTIKIPDKIMHRDDEDTAIRFPSDNTISFETAGTEKLEIDSGGQFIYYSVSTQAADFGTGAAGGAFHKYDLGAAGTTIGYLGSANNLVTSGNVADFALRSQGNLILASGGGTERLRIRSDGNVDINGTPPWTISGGNFRNLSISGEGASASGFLWLGNGAATNNADFDLGRINFMNGGTVVARVIGTTDTSANDDGRLRFITKKTGETEAERLRIDSAGRLLVNTTSTTNTDDFLTLKRPASGHSAISMTVDATTATGNYANAFIFTKSKGYYYNGLVFSSSDKHEGGIVARHTSSGSKDPSIEVRVGGTGINASDTLAININHSGYVTKPAHPSFHARLINHTNATANPLVFDDVIVNVGSHYKSSGSDAGKFVVPIAGTYFFFWEAIKNSTTSVTRLYLQKNGSRTYNNMHLRLQEEGLYANGCINAIMTLAVGDKIHIELAIGGVHAAEYTHFGGYLIG